VTADHLCEVIAFFLQSDIGPSYGRSKFQSMELTEYKEKSEKKQATTLLHSLCFLRIVLQRGKRNARGAKKEGRKMGTPRFISSMESKS